MSESLVNILIAVAATLLASGAVVFLVVRLISALTMRRLIQTVRAYPNVAMALALAAQGETEDTKSFSSWVAWSVENRGWEKTDAELKVVMGRLYPTGAVQPSDTGQVKVSEQVS